jgi:hypothetical protein
VPSGGEVTAALDAAAAAAEAAAEAEVFQPSEPVTVRTLDLCALSCVANLFYFN